MDNKLLPFSDCFFLLLLLRHLLYYDHKIQMGLITETFSHGCSFVMHHDNSTTPYQMIFCPSRFDSDLML